MSCLWNTRIMKLRTVAVNYKRLRLEASPVQHRLDHQNTANTSPTKWWTNIRVNLYKPKRDASRANSLFMSDVGFQPPLPTRLVSVSERLSVRLIYRSWSLLSQGSKIYPKYVKGKGNSPDAAHGALAGRFLWQSWHSQSSWAMRIRRISAD